ncbi:MAG: hypothetical protein ACEQSA_00820 [Weeksellaceae bacterium]
MTSRLESHRNRQLNSRTVFIIIGAIALALILFRVGLAILSSGSLFVNNLVTGEKVEEEQEDIFVGRLDVNEPEIATNAAQIEISGSVTGYDSVEFYINNVKVKEKNFSRDAAFSEVIGTLKDGANNIYLKASNEKSKQQKQSPTYQVDYVKDELKLEVESPKEGETFDKADVRVTGTTIKGATVSVNGSPVVVNFEGKFSSTYRLKEGENKLVVKAVDIAGNEEEKTITVRYEK